jgi:hypothetical protein
MGTHLKRLGDWSRLGPVNSRMHLTDLDAIVAQV